MRRLSLFLALIASVSAAYAQTGVGVELDEVVDNRVSAGMVTGSLGLRVKLKGAGLDKASAARVVVKEARDDRGTSLVDPSSSEDFTPRDYNSGTLQVSLNQPARAASSVRIKGSVELFVPSRDPNAILKIDKALTKLDTPLTAK